MTVHEKGYLCCEFTQESSMCEAGRLHSATGLTHCLHRGWLLHRDISCSPYSGVRKPLKKRGAGLCLCVQVEPGYVLKAEQPLASQICFDWCVYSCCIAWAWKGPAAVKQPNSDFSSSFLSLCLLSCLWSDGSWPASCIIKPFIYTLLTDATSRLGWGNMVCFLKPLGEIEFHGGVIYASEGFVNVGLQLHGAGILSSFQSRGTSGLNNCLMPLWQEKGHVRTISVTPEHHSNYKYLHSLIANPQFTLWSAPRHNLASLLPF